MPSKRAVGSSTPAARAPDPLAKAQATRRATHGRGLIRARRHTLTPPTTMKTSTTSFPRLQTPAPRQRTLLVLVRPRAPT